MAAKHYWIVRERMNGWPNYRDMASLHPAFRTSEGKVRGASGSWWSFDHYFPSASTVLDAIRGMRKLAPDHAQLGVTDNDGILIWTEKQGWLSDPARFSPAYNPQEEDMLQGTSQGDIDQPLHIPRETLISALQEKLDAARGEREEAAAKKAENRARVTAAVKSFSDDELVNIVQLVVGAQAAVDFEAWAEKAKEKGTYKSPEEKATPHEDTLEKTVRVLGMASDKEIEIKPNDPIYPLL